MIQITHLTKSYGKARGITDLTLHVPEGSCFGFIGPNGAGKSTTIRTLLGLITPTAGSARVLGLDCARDRTAILTQVGYMPSEAMFYPEMRVSEVIRLSANLRKRDCREEAAGLCRALRTRPPAAWTLWSSGPSGPWWTGGGGRGPRYFSPPTCSMRCSATATGRPLSGRGGW